MVELKKENLLYHFPFTPQGNNSVVKNETIYDVLQRIQSILWNQLSTGSSNRSADVELKLMDYQSDIISRIKGFDNMREELSEEMQKRQKSFQKERNQIFKKHVPKKVQAQGMNDVPFAVAEDPDAFKAEFNDLKDEYEDLLDKMEDIQEKFNQKMESATTVKLKNTEQFTRDELDELNGQLIRAVRPILKDGKGVEKEAST